MIDWRPQAACREIGPDPFRAGPQDEVVPGRPARGHGSDMAQAKAICAGCPVRAECLAAACAEERGQAITMRETIRGGLMPAERVALELAEGVCSDCGGERHPKTLLCDSCRAYRQDRDELIEIERLAWRRACLNCGDRMADVGKTDYCQDCRRVAYRTGQIVEGAVA